MVDGRVVGVGVVLEVARCGIGVEGGAVLAGDPVFDLEGDGPPVVGDVPRLSEPRDELAVLVGVDERLVARTRRSAAPAAACWSSGSCR